MAVTIKDVAREAGVAISTVSKHLNGGTVRPENAKAIDKAVEKLGFRLNLNARAIRGGTSGIIMLLMPSLNNSFCREILFHSQMLLQERGYNTIVAETQCSAEKEGDYLRNAISRRVDGILSLPTDLHNPAYHEVINAGVPIVIFSTPSRSLHSNYIAYDDDEKSLELLHMLSGLGHRRAGIIAGDVSRLIVESRGISHFISLITRGGMEFDKELVYFASGSDFAVGLQGARHFLSKPNRPDLLIGLSGDIMAGALMAAYELGLNVPQDVSICGTCLQSAVTQPPFDQFTAVAIPMDIGIERAVDLLLQCIGNYDFSHSVFNTVYLSANIYNGGSIAALPED